MTRTLHMNNLRKDADSLHIEMDKAIVVVMLGLRDIDFWCDVSSGSHEWEYAFLPFSCDSTRKEMSPCNAKKIEGGNSSWAVALSFHHVMKDSFSLVSLKIPEPSVVEERFCGQHEGLWFQLHLHASILHEAWYWPITPGILCPGRHLFQPHYALCQPWIPSHGGKILESPQRACQTPLHRAPPGQLGLRVVRGGDSLRLLAVFHWPGWATSQPPLLWQYPSL